MMRDEQSPVVAGPDRALRLGRLGVGVIACAMILLGAGGCASEGVRMISSDKDFQQVVLKSDQPVLVDFYKQGGCPTCVALYPVLNNVADEYRGRVTVARYAVMTQFFQPTTTYKDTYNIQVVPTAVLFVHGREVKRWVMGYDIDDYRNTLDLCLRAKV